MNRIILVISIILLQFLFINIECKSQQILKSFDGGTAGQYQATFNFENLPNPLTICYVNYSIKVTTDYETDKYHDLHLRYPKGKVKIVSDTIINLPEIVKKGDIHNGTIAFIPLTSGHYSIELNDRGPIDIYHEERKLVFAWCLDALGNLQYLGNPYNNKCKCKPIITQFFTPDSIQISNPESGSIGDWSVSISPTPKTGDTSLVVFTISPVYDDLETGADLEMSTKNINAISLPKAPNKHIGINDEFYVKFKIVPEHGYNYQRIVLQVNSNIDDEIASESSQTLSCIFYFNDDGDLLYVDSQDPFRFNVSKKPKKLTTTENSDFTQNIKIFKDGRDPVGSKDLMKIYRNQKSEE